MVSWRSNLRLTLAGGNKDNYLLKHRCHNGDNCFTNNMYIIRLYTLDSI